MAAMDDYLSWLNENTTPNSQMRGSGFSGVIGGVEKAVNKSIMPESYRQTMGVNDSSTDNNNAWVGANTMQPLNFNNDWVKSGFDGGGSGPSASNIGMAVAAPGVSAIQDALKTGVPMGDIDIGRVLGSGMNPGGFVKALTSGVPLGDVDWNKVISTDPITGVAAAVADPLVTKVTGSKLAGDVVGAGASTGMAAAQGFANPMSDLAALGSYFNLFKRFI